MNDVNEGWIALYRVLLSKPIWNKATAEQKVVLITLLLMANHKESEWNWKGEKFSVLPGQFVCSLNSIIKKAGKGISIQNVRSSLALFKKLEFSTYKSTKEGRLITICNWDSYQIKLTEGQQSTQPTGNKGATTNKNVRILEEEISVIFEDFRQQFPGTKRGLKTEFDNFTTKNKPEIVEFLLPALNKEKHHRESLQKLAKFIPPWKNLSTWINQKCWEQEFSEASEQQSAKLKSQQSEIPSTDRKYKAI